MIEIGAIMNGNTREMITAEEKLTNIEETGEVDQEAILEIAREVYSMKFIL